MILNGFFKGTIVDILEPKTTGGQICKWNTKALLSDTVVIIVADKKNTKLNKELRNQLFKEYCGIYTGVVILKDTDIKLGDELRILKGIGINSLILRCFLTTPIYEHLRGVLGMKMLNNRDAYFTEPPKPVKKIKSGK